MFVVVVPPVKGEPDIVKGEAEAAPLPVIVKPFSVKLPKWFPAVVVSKLRLPAEDWEKPLVCADPALLPPQMKPPVLPTSISPPP